MFTFLAKWGYIFLVRSRLLYFVYPVISFISKFLVTPEMFKKQRLDKANNYIEDRSGAKIMVTRVNGRSYPFVGVEKILSIKNVKIRKDDIILCSYPKSGSHWTHEVLHMLVTGRVKLSTQGKVMSGSFLEMPDFVIDSMPSPRVVNSHLLYNELPTGIIEKKTKIILLLRNPKDVVVSFYNHYMNLKIIYNYDGTFDDFFELYIEGNLIYGGIFDYILDWDRVMKTQSNPILLITYENMKAKPKDVMFQIAKFLEISVTEQFLEEVIEACSFDKMRAKRSKEFITNEICRKGVVGDWRNWLSEDQSQRIDKVWKERMLGCTYQPVY